MESSISAILGFLTGVLATWFFWQTLLWQRPKITIADKVSVETNSQTGKKELRFKIYNAGKNQVTSIKVNAWLCDLHDTPSGAVARGVHHLPIPNSETLTLCAKGKEDRPWGLPPEKTFASSPEVDFTEFLQQPNTRLMFVVRASDAISGSTIVKQITYSKRDLVLGTFTLGESLDVFPS